MYWTERGREIVMTHVDKERDLQLAAEIGHSLLERNHELQTRNEFLEEALLVSNDTVVQLRHELQIRANLLHMYAENDNDWEPCTSRHSNNENIQRRMRRLENENERLRCEATNLKKNFVELEEKERLNISEWNKQLDSANDKINRLQQSLAEKIEECRIQSFEVERLLKEVAARSSHEKTLVSENDNLNQQLEGALTMHEELTAQISELQERYTEIAGMLRDAEEELKTYRQTQSAYSTSADSLYDSLASEIEASDSGFYSTISNTSKVEKSISSKKNMKDLAELQYQLTSMKSCTNGGDGGAVISVETVTRSVATATDPLPNYCEENSHCTEDIVDVPNHVLASLLRRPRLVRQTNFPTCVEGSFTTSGNDSDNIELSLTTETVAKHFDFSSNSARTSTSQQQNFRELPNSPSCPGWLMRDLNRISGHSSISSTTLSKTTSTESLAGYEGPKMGEPGRPGTRDLDWSIRKLNIRLEVEKEYAKFRRERGLLPSNVPFFTTPSKKNYRTLEKCHKTGSIVQYTSISCGSQQKQVIANGLSRVFKPWKILSNAGLFASLQGNLAQGILVRSAIPFTPPSTPVRQERSTIICKSLSRLIFSHKSLTMKHSIRSDAATR
ncbi:unnamed protein product [Thelazia callipaeda]|uniref:HAP1 N-terminal domain-containing protein n=1 Tax=Thelazia callipaeda TaxID=103827 RepID=A0A0N5CXS6_THECL|nr:unnamed protein product [Thelazia callipaeda]